VKAYVASGTSGSGITQGEFDIMNRNKCKLSWLCDICKPQLLKEKEQDDLLKKLNQKVDLIMQILTKDMREMMENAVEKTNDQNTEIRQTVNKEKQPSPEKTEDRNGKAIEHSKPGKESTGRGTREEGRGTSQNEEKNEQDSSTDRNFSNGDVQENGKQQPWVEVVARRKTHTSKPREVTTIIGTMNTTNTNLKPGEKFAWLYVGKLHPTTTQGRVVEHLESNGIVGKIVCEELETKGYFKAFKVGIPYENLEKVNTAEFWPAGVLVRQFRFRRQRQLGTQL
jgi:hypothetical protein